MRIEVVDSLNGMEALQPEWLSLWRNCPRATPFQAPQWLLPWTRHLFGGGQLRMLTMWDGTTLAGLGSLFQWGTNEQTVSFLAAGVSDYGDLLFLPGCEAACAQALRGFLHDSRDKWDVLDLQELRAGSGMLAGLPETWVVEECSVCPVLELSAWPGAMDSKQRTDWHRARNRLLKNGDFQFLTTSPETVDSRIADFFRLHEARWGALTDPLRRFHREVAEGFCSTGDLGLSVLRIGGRAAGAIYGFRAGRTLYCYLSGFDPELARFSPGAVLLGWVIEQAVAEGIEQIDFLRQGEAYKYLWGARDRVNYRVTAGTI